MVVGLFYGFYRKYKNPIEFTWLELPIQSLAGIIVTIGCFGTFLFWSSGLEDTEIWNGRVSIAEYYEEWIEEVTYYEEVCSGTGESRSCTNVMRTRNDYHPPYWQIITSNNETVSISKSNYQKYVSQFGGHIEKNLSRTNQVSYGDGDKYIATWNGKKETMIPVSVEHKYVNYLKASKSLHKRSGVSISYQDYLLPYPNVTGGKFGQIEFNRVVSSGDNISAEWKTIVNKELDKALAYIASQKQLNIVVYTVNTSDRAFLHTLEEYWTFGKKNDVVVVLGITEFPKVDWAGVMVFHGNETLRVKLRDSIVNMDNISDPVVFSQLVVDHINQDFKRVPMAEMEHLLHDIEIPWWIILLVWILVGTVVFVVSFMLENNQTRNRRF